MKKISVIVPIYKAEEYLPKCVDSIINQTYTNLEIILVDDGSPDNSGAICDDYAKKDNRIKVIHKANEGVSMARNAGLDFCTGDFVAFVDNDDFLQPTMYEELIAKQKEKDADLTFCRYNSVRNNNIIPVIETKLKDFCEDKNFAYFLNHDVAKKKGNAEIVNHQILGYIWRILYKKECLQNVRFLPNCRLGEDTLFLLELIKQNLTYDYLDKPLYNYLIRQASASHNTASWIINNSILYINNLERILGQENFEYISASKFTSYCFASTSLLKGNGDVSELKRLEDWNNKVNYKNHKKINFGLKRIRSFLIYHKMFFIYKFLLKLYSKIKK